MKLAAVSSKCKIGEVKQNLSTTVAWIEKLDKQGVDFILFPELNLSGYTKNIQVLDSVLAQKEVVFQQLTKLSVDVKSAFAVGFPERVNENYYISHFLFNKGKHIGTHRKTHLGPTEKEQFAEGDEINVFDLGELKIGVQLCFETHFSEISFIQAKQGAQVLAMAFASPRENGATKLERFKRFLPARAYDNACFVMACNLRQDVHNDLQNSVNNFPGLGVITGAKGIILEESNSMNEDFILAEIDTREIERIKKSRMGYFNCSKRENLFRKYYGNMHEERRTL